MATVIFILLSVIWLSMAVTYHALRQRHPWQLLDGDRRRVKMVRVLEELRHALGLLFWVVSVYLLLWLVGFADQAQLSAPLAWVFVLATAGELVSRNRQVQTFGLNMVYAISQKYGRYLNFIPAILRVIEPAAAKLAPDLPVFRDRSELTHLVQHQHHAHKVLTAGEERQVQALLAADTRTIDAKVLPLKDIPMVRAEDTIGPLLLSELHDSAYASFLVYAKRRSKIVGVLDQGVAVSHAAKGSKVSSIMEERIVYLPHNATTRQALQTFVETSSPISVIIDDDNQPMGVLYIQDVLRDLFEAKE